MNTFTIGSRKYRLRSKLRFIVSLTVMAVLLTGIAGFITGMNVSDAQTREVYHSVEVAYGDTLWDIADEYRNDDTEIRQAVHTICMENDIKADDLEPGMTLKVPADL